MSEVIFIGAGPGDPELLTLKGKKAIDSADVIIYAGSLVNPQVLDDRKPTAKVYDSAGMNLQEQIDVMLDAVKQGQSVARVHTGDPSIYGSIREQIEELKKQDIAYRVIPGVSSFLAGAAAVKREFTVPGISQTVICTRMEGRTPVPDLEQIELLASHKTSMAIFLSVGMIEKLVERLTVHYPKETPVAVIEKASWADERKAEGTLETIAQIVKNAGITKTAMILVGDFLGDYYENSKLYDAGFSHEYRAANSSSSS